ncbi:MAG TPA: sigma-70 family RNA polymerase sigma factor [bacterium]|nr:sigma-70 family RNA polymerase sigma factor [bacterium]
MIEFEETLRRCRKPLLSMAWRMLGDREEAEDAVQEAFIRFWQLDPAAENPDGRFSLLARMVVNRCLDQLRRRKRRMLIPPGWLGERVAPENPETLLDRRDLESAILKTADRLRPKQKAVFLLRDVEGYPVKEIADMLGDTENGIRVNLHLARKNMRKWLKPLIGGPESR